MQEWLSDAEAPWWAKLRRAQIHINEVRQRVDALQSAEMWSIQRKRAKWNGWAYRFRTHRAIPADLAAAVGDAIANMRSALDYVAYELARHHLSEIGKEMGDDEEAATAFPIRKDEQSFEQFFKQGKQLVVEGKKVSIRSELYGDAERKALWCVQPFALAAEARDAGVEISSDPQDDLRTDAAYGLNTIWNIDKHRRLPELAWGFDLVWWSRADPVYRWVGHVEQFAPLQDGTVLGELYGPRRFRRPQTDARFDLHLVLSDDPSYPSALVGRLEHLHRSLTHWVIPRIFIVAEGHPPPIMISFSPPT